MNRILYGLNWIGVDCEDNSIKRDLELSSEYESGDVYHFGYKINVDCIKNQEPWHRDWIKKICVNKKTKETIIDC